MVWVNALWLISLVLSLTCALIATLLQQWARRYTETPKFSNMLRHRARVRSLLVDGTKLYKIPLIVEILPTLLHLSVYLFLGGLVIAFHTVHKTVAIAVDAAVGVSGLAYVALSILPCLDVKCPYRTPISKILWYPCHILPSLAVLCLNCCLQALARALLAFYTFLARRRGRQSGLRRRPPLPRGPGVLQLQRWLWSRNSAASNPNRWKFLTDGLEERIVHRAIEMLKDGDRGRVTWLFNQLALGDKQKFHKFAASIPIHKINDLIPTIEVVPFRESLHVLLQSCVASKYTTSSHDDIIHERSLSVCLHAIHHIVKASAATTLDLYFMRTHFANTVLMRSLWGDMDDFIRITSRSICALVAKRVVREQWSNNPDTISWLQEVTGEPSNSIFEADVTVREQMILKSFVNGALLPHHDLSAENATSFKETLKILLGALRTDGHEYFTTLDWKNRLSEEVRRIQQYDPQGGFELFNRLRLVFPSLPPVTSADAVVHPSHLIPPPSPILHPPPSTYPVPPRAPPSPRPVPFHAAAPPPPPPIYPPRTIRRSHRDQRVHHHAPI